MNTETITGTDRFEFYDQVAEKITQINRHHCIVNVTTFFDNVGERHVCIINFQ